MFEVIAGNFTWEGATKECNNEKESLNVELSKTCSNNNNDGEKYWFGFGTVEYTDEYIKFNSKDRVCKENTSSSVIKSNLYLTRYHVLFALSRCARCQFNEMPRL